MLGCEGVVVLEMVSLERERREEEGGRVDGSGRELGVGRGVDGTDDV